MVQKTSEKTDDAVQNKKTEKKYSRRPKNINTLPEPRTILMEIYIPPDKLEEIIDERLLL